MPPYRGSEYKAEGQMSERNFHMRLSCRYEGQENNVIDLRVEVLEEGQWETFDLNVKSAGFWVCGWKRPQDRFML